MPLQQVAHSPISEFILEIVLAKPKVKISKGQVRANKRENKRSRTGENLFKRNRSTQDWAKSLQKEWDWGKGPHPDNKPLHALCKHQFFTGGVPASFTAVQQGPLQMPIGTPICSLKIRTVFSTTLGSFCGLCPDGRSPYAEPSLGFPSP